MKHIFWGLFFVFFHFRINGFDLLPDILGYLFVSYGLYTLADKNNHFKNALCCSIGLVILQATDFLFLFFSSDVMIYLFLQIVAITVSIMMFYFMSKGFKELEIQNELHMKTDVFLKVWRIQSISQILSFVLPFFVSETMLYAAAFSTIILFGTNLIFMFYIHKARKQYSNEYLRNS